MPLLRATAGRNHMCPSSEEAEGFRQQVNLIRAAICAVQNLSPDPKVGMGAWARKIRSAGA